MIKNLITHKDLKLISQKSEMTRDELTLFQEQSRSEKEIQIACGNIFRARYGALTGSGCFFQQNDNGGSDRISTKVSKKAQGTISGWPDVTLWHFTSLELLQPKVSLFVEFKKPGVITLSKRQEEVHRMLKEHGEIVEVCNNTVYFDKVICQKFENL